MDIGVHHGLGSIVTLLLARASWTMVSRSLDVFVGSDCFCDSVEFDAGCQLYMDRSFFRPWTSYFRTDSCTIIDEFSD